jgi:predicted  nucleic acid-binding Zn-ribbon protein
LKKSNFTEQLITKVLSAKKTIYKPPRGSKKMSSLKNTIEKIKNLETEKKNLLLEIEGLKKTADAKATALESEVGSLRDEVKSLKTLISGSEPSENQGLKK